MKKGFEKLKWLEWYLIANMIILGIVTLAGGYGFTLLIDSFPSSMLNFISGGGLSFLGIIGAPILLFFSGILPQLVDMEYRLVGTAITLGFVFLAIIVFELLRRFVKNIREKSLYSDEAYRQFTLITWCLAVIFSCNFVVTYIVSLRYIFSGNIVLYGGFTAVDFVTTAVRCIPIIGVILVAGLFFLRKTYRDAIELKKDNELTV